MWRLTLLATLIAVSADAELKAADLAAVRATVDRLEKTTEIEVIDGTIKDMLKLLEKMHGITFDVRSESLLDKPLVVKLSEPVHDVLSRVLKAAGGEWAIRPNGEILVTSIADAESAVGPD